MSYRVHIVRDGSALCDFLDLPERVYHNDPFWVAPLRSEVVRTLDARKNPYFRGGDVQKFVCYHGAQPVARAVSVVNPKHWAKFGEKAAFFGFFECMDDPRAAMALFEEIGSYCRQKGADSLEGPFNPNHYSELGLLVRNYSMPVFFETYNPPYYAALLESAGFRPIYHMHTRVSADARSFMNAKPAKSMDKLLAGGYTVRNLRLLHVKADLERIREVYNDAFAGNWHFLPVSAAEYAFVSKGLFWVTKPGLICIVEHKGEPVGVVQFMFNVNPLLAPMRGRITPWSMLKFLWQRRQVREIVLYAVGIKKAYQKSKVLSLLYEAMHRIVQKYPTAYCTWTTDDNIAAIKAAESVGLEPYKWFTIFGKRLNDKES